jgi:hypothetical protein
MYDVKSDGTPDTSKLKIDSHNVVVIAQHPLNTTDDPLDGESVMFQFDA